MTLKALLRRIKKDDYTLIVWATATPSIRSDMALATKIKALASNVRTGAFGTHVTALADRCLRESPYLDFIIRNEPEASLNAIANALANGNGPQGILGISYREKRGEICHNQARPFISDLDKMPFPAWHLLDLERYRLPLTGTSS